MSVSPPVEPARPVAPPAAPPAVPPTTAGRWTAARIVSVVAGSLLGLASLGLLSAGGWATWMTNTQREDGYLTPSAHTITTASPAITSGEVGELAGQAWSGLLGDVRVRATSTDPSSQVFIGLAPTAAVDRYLSGVGQTTVTDWFPLATHDVGAAGAPLATAPTDVNIWMAQVSGTGRQSLTWEPSSGTTVVVMHPDGSSPVSAVIDVGAQAPDLAWLAVACFVIGGLMLGAAIVLIVVPVRRAGRP